MKVWPPHLTQYKPQNHKSSLKKGKRKDKVSDKEIIGNNDESIKNYLLYLQVNLYRIAIKWKFDHLIEFNTNHKIISHPFNHLILHFTMQ